MAVAEISEKKVEVQSKRDSANVPGMVCPMCGVEVRPEAIECPSCGEPFSPEAFEVRAPVREKRSKWLFYSGVLLVLIGGPGVALGSWLHDLLMIPIANFDNFDSFGWANKLVAAVGIVILVIGIVLLILSLPRGRLEESEKDEELTIPEK